MNLLFSTRAGSHLYGLNTPTSDVDIKHVVLPDLDDLLLGKQLKNVVNKTNSTTEKNTASDIDTEFIPLQNFARGFLTGQTAILELAFAIDTKHAQQMIHDERFTIFDHELREQFLTSNIKAMVGYVINQASIYSMKGDRLAAITEVLEFITKFLDYSKRFDAALSDLMTLPSFKTEIENISAKYPSYFKITEYDASNGKSAPCLILLSTTLPFTNSLATTHEVITRLFKKYGNRSAASMEAGGVDWKAMMHAARIAGEGIQILDTHKLNVQVSIDERELLLGIKRGEFEYDVVKELISARLERLMQLEKETTLPALTPQLQVEFDSWLLYWLHIFYFNKL